MSSRLKYIRIKVWYILAIHTGKCWEWPRKYRDRGMKRSELEAERKRSFRGGKHARRNTTSLESRVFGPLNLFGTVIPGILTPSSTSNYSPILACHHYPTDLAMFLVSWLIPWSLYLAQRTTILYKSTDIEHNISLTSDHLGIEAIAVSD